MNKVLIIVLFVTLFAQTIVFGQEFAQIADGIEHAKFTRKIKDEPVNVNLLKLDLTKVRLDVVHALDAAIGLETTSSIANRHGAIAAINAGFFKMEGLYKGDAAGVLQIDGKLLSESYANRISFGILNEKNMTTVDFGHLYSESYFVNNNRAKPISGINRLREANDIILYTPEFHRTTLSNKNGTEFIIKGKNLTEIKINQGSSIIPFDGNVISISNNIGDDYISSQSSVEIITKVVSKEAEKQIFFSKAEDIVAGVPQLIKNGKIEITWQQEKIGKDFLETRHPRTAVAKLKDGKFLMITVDGRQPNVSVGMNLYELAEMLLEFGAIEAMNLDGGGSTTMFVKDKVVNIPSDKTGERPVSDAILVTLRNKN